MKPAKDMKQTLRYRNMVAGLKGRPAHVKEAAMIKEIVGGKQWRMDAVLDAIDTNPSEWNLISRINIFQHAAMFGRLATIRRMTEDPNFGYQPVTGYRPSPHEILAAFNVAVIHGHYKVAEYCYTYGARPNHEMTHRATTPQAIYHVSETHDMKKVNYVIKTGGNPDFILRLADKSNLELVKHLNKHIATKKPPAP